MSNALTKAIRQMANEYAEKTGEMIFMGVENRPHKVWLFSDRSFTNEKEAYDYMYALLTKASEGQ